MFWDSQVFGVIVGFLLSAPLALWLDWRRGRGDKLEAARAVRREAHARALVAMSDYIAALNRFRAYVENIHEVPPPERDRARRETMAMFESAASAMDHAVLHAKAFAAHGVSAAVMDLQEFGAGFAMSLHQRKLVVDPEDFNGVAEDLLRLAGKVAQEDTDSQRGAIEMEHLRIRNGRYSWLPDDPVPVADAPSADAGGE